MMTSNVSLVVAVCLILAGLDSRHAAAQENPSDLVTVEHGQLPIILSAPHGGRDDVPGALVRRDAGVEKFSCEPDTDTDQLTEQLADEIEKKLGQRPYLVLARFHRKYVDANRPGGIAYESKQSKECYNIYHQALADARADVIRRWGRGVLFDVHGQATEPKAIFRGTDNWNSVNHLLGRFGREALRGENSVFGSLASQGVPVIPAIGSGLPENPKYDGGYIVQTYGSGGGGTVDAIQLELGRDLRTSQVIASTADKLANAIATFAVAYLPQAPKQPARAEIPPAENGDVLVGVYRDVGAGPSAGDLMRVLRSFENIDAREINAYSIRSGALSNLDVLIQPGGSGGKQGRYLGEVGRDKIRQFIDGGGGYIGICGGAYLASADYSWSLNVLDAKVLDRKHWDRGKGMVEIDLSDVGRRVLRSNPQQTIYYAQGPLLAPANREDIADYETMATFKTEITKNGAPQGVMPGTTAIAQGQYGRGRVVCFSPHPELTDGLEVMVHHALDHVKRIRPNEQIAKPASDPRRSEESASEQPN